MRLKTNKLHSRRILDILSLILLFALFSPAATGASVTLQAAESENLDDGMAVQNYPATEYGSYNQFNVGAPGSAAERQSYIKFSLASIPQGSTITNSSLQLYYSYDGMETDDRLVVSAYYVLPEYAVGGQVWSEGSGSGSGDACTGSELCWSTRPVAGQISSTPDGSFLFDRSLGGFSGWYAWPVAQAVQQAVGSGSGSVTIALLSSWGGGSLAVSDFLGFRTKEHWDSSFRPRLVIEYETGPVDDVAVASVSAPVLALQGAVVQVNVSVRNEGNRVENFTVVVNDTTDGVLIGATDVVNLNGGGSLALLYSWDTSAASLGSHIISASASIVPGETDVSDNVKNAAVQLNVQNVSTPVYNQRIKGAAYKPNYGNETVEFVVAVMDNKTSIEGNARFVGTDDWNVSYRVINPDSTIYQDWLEIALNNSWGLSAFGLLTNQTGTFTIELRLANETGPSSNVTFSVSGNNKVPFYRDEIIKAADFVVSLQNPDGSFPQGGGYTSPGSPARVLMWAYRITGNTTYYDAAVNYLEDQINCAGSDSTLYSTCAYAEFQLFSNDRRFENNLNSCSQATYNLRDISPYYIERGEASYCLYKTWEATGNSTIRYYADDMVNSILAANSWNAAKNTWYFTSSQTYYDGIFTGTLTALGLYWYPNISYITNAIKAQNLFVPQFYQDSVYGSGSTPSLYSLEISGNLESGHFPHFTAEPAIAMLGLYNATGSREWLLKAALPAAWIAKSQESDGHFEDSQSPSDDIWATMWSVWGLHQLPWEARAEVVGREYNLTISDAWWNAAGKELWANAAVPSGENGKIRLVIPENENPGSVLIDGAATADYAQNGRNVVVDVAEGSHIITVLWGIDTTPPLRFNPQPSGTLPSGTIETTISLNTNENAACGYSTAAGTSYDSMTNFSSTGTTAHTAAATGLSDGNNYTYYAKCSDLKGNVNQDDFAIRFSISSPDTSAPVMNLMSPQNATYNSGNVQLLYSATDNVAVNNCWYNLNNGNNVTLPGCGNTTLSLQSGAYALYLYANDTSGNIGVGSVAFAVNLTQPPGLNTTSVNVLDDTFASESSPAADYGTGSQIGAGGPAPYRRESYLKFNLSAIPPGSTVYEANLSLYISYHGLESDDIINITANLVYPLYSINNREWDEGNGDSACSGNELCWNTRPSPSQMEPVPESGTLFSGAAIQTGSWGRWKVTDIVQQAVNNGNANVTIRLNSVQVQSATEASDIVQFRSKEYYIAGLRPLLNIRYGN